MKVTRYGYATTLALALVGSLWSIEAAAAQSAVDGCRSELAQATCPMLG